MSKPNNTVRKDEPKKPESRRPEITSRAVLVRALIDNIMLEAECKGWRRRFEREHDENLFMFKQANEAIAKKESALNTSIMECDAWRATARKIDESRNAISVRADVTECRMRFWKAMFIALSVVYVALLVALYLAK